MTHITGGRFNRLLVVIGAAVAFASSVPVSAQEARGAAEVAGAAADEASADEKPTGSIEGTVHDPSGAAVTEAALTIKNLATDESLGSISDASGAFSIQNLAPGSYQIRAQKPGFREADATIVVAASQRLHADVRLQRATTADDPA